MPARPVATGAGACLSPVRYGAAGLPAPNRRAAARLAAWAGCPARANRTPSAPAIGMPAGAGVARQELETPTFAVVLATLFAMPEIALLI